MLSLQGLIIGCKSANFIVYNLSRFPFIGIFRNFRQYRSRDTVNFLLHGGNIGHITIILEGNQAAEGVGLSRLRFNRAYVIHYAGTPKAADIQIRPVKPNQIFHVDGGLHIADSFPNLLIGFVPPFQILAKIHYSDAGRRTVFRFIPGCLPR